MVVASALSLLFGLPARLLSAGDVGWRRELAELTGVTLAYALLSGPFDLFGGWILSAEYGRSTRSFAAFLPGWLRGAAVHGAILTGTAFLLLRAARAGGFFGLLGAFAGVNLLLLLAQPLLASVVGGLRRVRSERIGGVPVDFVAGDDLYFTGGIGGLPGRERILIPVRWEANLTLEQLDAVISRRTGLLRGGSRSRGVALALAWNAAGFALAGSFSSDPASVAGLVAIFLRFTLWSFLGLLLLPAPSQRGVFEGDAFAVNKTKGKSDVRLLGNLIARLDQDQDDERARSRVVETYFHPIPSVERRIAALESGAEIGGGAGAWHAARTALYLSWAGVGFLSRAVHCNAGRPDAWVFLPSD